MGIIHTHTHIHICVCMCMCVHAKLEYIIKYQDLTGSGVEIIYLFIISNRAQSIQTFSVYVCSLVEMNFFCRTD
jgi:hypothetical protein